MLCAHGIEEPAHNLPAIINPTGYCGSGLREIDRGVDAVVQEEAMRLLDRFSEKAHDLSAIINRGRYGKHRAWRAELGEDAIVEENAMG